MIRGVRPRLGCHLRTFPENSDRASSRGRRRFGEPAQGLRVNHRGRSRAGAGCSSKKGHLNFLSSRLTKQPGLAGRLCRGAFGTRRRRRRPGESAQSKYCVKVGAPCSLRNGGRRPVGSTLQLSGRILLGIMLKYPEKTTTTLTLFFGGGGCCCCCCFCRALILTFFLTL